MSVALCRAQGSTQLLSLTNTTWRFNDSGQDLGTAWKATSYPNESAWPAGKALFGVESSSPYPYPVPIQTPLVLGAGRITYYFRTHFTVSQNPGSLWVTLSAYVDDGAILYVNGTEIGRIRLPAGAVTYTNLAQLATHEGVPDALNFPGTSLVQGDNVIAVEVHQYSSTSSDVIFGLSLQAVVAVAPIITTPDEPASRTVLQGRSAALSIAASGVPAPALQWFKESSPIPGATNSSLTLSNFMTGDAGDYFVVASNFVGSVTSRTAVVTYQSDTTAPAILYALGQSNRTNILVVFTEAPDASLGEVQDAFSWCLVPAGGDCIADGLVVYGGTISNGTNVVLTTDPRDPSQSYVLRTMAAIHDPFGNALPFGTAVPVASFPAQLIAMDETHSWRYEQSGADLGNAWTNGAYSDSSWSNGAAVFDVFRNGPDALPGCRLTLPSNGETVRTCLMLSNAQNTAQLSAVYFRTHFQFEGDAAHTVLRLRTLLDDGAVFYLNGAELLRAGMTAGPVIYQTLASRSVGDANYEDFLISAPGLVAGDNVLAVELHQESLTSPDLTFGLSLVGVLPALVTHPRLEIERSGGNVTLMWTPAVGTLQASDEAGGTWTDITPSNPPNQHVAALSEAPRKFYRVVVP